MHKIRIEMEEILKQFPDLTELQQAQFEQLYDLYQDWNAKNQCDLTKRHR